jgi:hypothetical protein
MPGTSIPANGNIIGSANIAGAVVGRCSMGNSARLPATGSKSNSRSTLCRRAEWRSAAWMWRAIRDGTIDENICGIGFVGIQGRRFVASAALRDAAELAGIECLPWDYWGPGREFLRGREVSDEEAKRIDALAEALDPAPENRDDAESVIDRFPWARPTETVASVIMTTPVGVPIRPAN